MQHIAIQLSSRCSNHFPLVFPMVFSQIRRLVLRFHPCRSDQQSRGGSPDHRGNHWSTATRPGKHTKNYGKIHHFSWENPLFLWPFSIAMLNYQRLQFANWKITDVDPFWLGKSSINHLFLWSSFHSYFLAYWRLFAHENHTRTHNTIHSSVHQFSSSFLATLFQNRAMFTSSPQGFEFWVSKKVQVAASFAQSWPCSPSFQWCAQGWWWFSNRSSSTSPGAWRSCAGKNSPVDLLGVAPVIIEI